MDGTLVDLHGASNPNVLKTYASALLCKLQEMLELRKCQSLHKYLLQLNECIDKGYNGSTLTERQMENWIA